MGWKIFFHRGEKKVQNFQNFENFENLDFFLKTQHFDILKNFRILRFLKISKVFKIFENFENFWDFENFEIFWNVVDRKKFQPNNFRFFFDDLFRSQISPRFQKSHLENRVMSSKMWKSDFLRFWYTFTWPQGSDLAKIRLFDLWISKYSGKSQKKNLRKKIQNFFFDRKNIFSQTYTIARFLICLHYEPKDYVKPKILWIRDFCAVTTILWHLNSVARGPGLAETRGFKKYLNCPSPRPDPGGGRYVVGV